jgi:tetratricopeptide (TPR) repeat protein
VAERAGDRGGALRSDVDDQRAAAEADYRKALELLRDRPGDELNYVVRVNRGVLALERGDLAAAESDLSEAVRLDGRRHQAFAARAEVYRRQGRFDEAVAEFGRAVAARPGWAPLYRERAQVTVKRPDASAAQRREARRDLEEAARLEAPGDPVLALDHALRARLLLRDRRDAEALAACDAALAAVPDYADAHLLRVEALLALRRFDEVTASCDAALARGRPSAELHALRGLARSGLRDFPGAIEDDTRSLALRPGQPRVLRNRGWSYYFANAPDLAVRDFSESIRLDPSDGDAYNGRGSALVRLGRHREAVADAEEALRLGGGSAQVAYNAARVYAQACSAAAAEVEKSGRDAAARARRYQDRAVALLTTAAARLPAADRPAFWRDQVSADPALHPLRERLKRLDPTASFTTAPAPKP